MTTTPLTGAPDWAAAQASPWLTENKAKRMLEAMARAAVIEDRDLTTPPVSCADGACYLVATSGGGLWAGKTGQLALSVGVNAANGWYFIVVAIEGNQIYIKDENISIRYDGAAWVTTSSGVVLDTDGTLAANSDAVVPSQKAVKTYVDTAVTGLLDFKGSTDCSANPNYPAASKGDSYVVSVAGKIGGASGSTVEAGDMFFAKADNAGGTQAGVGASWDIIQFNLLSAYVVGGTDVAVADGGTGSSTAAGARTNLGATTTGANLFTVADPGAITFLRVNADDSVSLLSAASFRTAIGAGTGSGSGDMLAANNLSDVANAATAGANIRPVESLIISCSDETTALTSGTGKVTFRMPYAFTVTDVRASLVTAQTSGSIFTVDINESGTSIISTKLTIDNTEKTSTTAATPPVISDSSIADDAEMTVDIDQVGDGTAKGLKITLIGHRT